MGKFRPKVMKDLGDYTDFQYLPELMKAAREVIFKSNPNAADMNECLVFLLFKTGRRPDELVETKVMDIDFSERMINWHIKKKRSPHQERLPIDKNTAEYLQWYIHKLKLLPHHYLFSWIKYGVTSNPKYYCHLDRRRAWQILKLASEMTGVKTKNGKFITPRIARHSYAAHLIKKKKSINIIKDLLVHSDIAITAVYAQLDKSDLRDQVDEALEDE